MLGSIYKNYLKTLGSLGAFLPSEHTTPSSGDERTKAESSQQHFKTIDARATALGNRYRGIGVSVGILGVLIVFCAVAPIGLSLEEHAAEAMSVIEFLMMVLTVALIIYGRKSDIRKDWIAARSSAEQARYQELSALIQAGDATKLRLTLQTILAGDFGQIQYNKGKHAIYEKIERFSNLFTWVCFCLAFSGAVLHLFIHASWLIFLTAFLPAFVGAVHGINGFLQIEDLAEQHHQMAARLEEALEGLNDPQKDVIGWAELAYQQLTSRDLQWAEKAKKLNLKPA